MREHERNPSRVLVGVGEGLGAALPVQCDARAWTEQLDVSPFKENF